MRREKMIPSDDARSAMRAEAGGKVGAAGAFLGRPPLWVRWRRGDRGSIGASFDVVVLVVLAMVRWVEGKEAGTACGTLCVTSSERHG
jgi:hypothetical protein